MDKQKRRIRTDESIREDAIQALFENYSVDSTAIIVSAKDGVITLEGVVESVEEIQGASRCIQNLTGVLEVINHLKLRHPPKKTPLVNPGFETGLS